MYSKVSLRFNSVRVRIKDIEVTINSVNKEENRQHALSKVYM